MERGCANKKKFPPRWHEYADETVERNGPDADKLVRLHGESGKGHIVEIDPEVRELYDSVSQGGPGSCQSDMLERNEAICQPAQAHRPSGKSHFGFLPSAKVGKNAPSNITRKEDNRKRKKLHHNGCLRCAGHFGPCTLENHTMESHRCLPNTLRIIFSTPQGAMRCD
jgi:hypothetical protein